MHADKDFAAFSPDTRFDRSFDFVDDLTFDSAEAMASAK
jgi:hypothetical protein